MSTSAYRERTGVLRLAFSAFVSMLFIACAACAFAPSRAYAASDVYLADGDICNLSDIESATRIHVNSGGTVTISGASSKVVLIASPPSGEEVNIIFDAVTLEPGAGAPGASHDSRSAITIEETGGTVNLISMAGTTSTFGAYGNLPAIRKDATSTRLSFQTTDPDNPGTIKAQASADAYRTCAIGCYALWWTAIGSNTTGNMFFESGNVEAYGSRGTTGGPGIGASSNGSVDGITFCGANVVAVAGDTSCAAIGTSSAKVSLAGSSDEPPSSEFFATSINLISGDGDFYHGATCRNITVSAGSVTATHHAVASDGGGAGIGGGRGTSASNITVSGGTVEAQAGEFAAAIGGGSDGDGLNIQITGGTVKASGGATGIGGGYAEGAVDGNDKYRFGDATVVISGGSVEASGGVGIGGWKGQRGNGEIIITGGTVTAESTGNGAGIGGGATGTIARIYISGGTVFAQGGEGEVGIGTTLSAGRESTCQSINISGGTVTARGGSKAAADLGGYAAADSGQSGSATPVYISGGNVRASKGAFQTTPQQYEGGPKVYLNKINLESFDDEVSEDMVVKAKGLAIQVDSDAYSYGMNDLALFMDDIELWLWLPENASVSSAELDCSYNATREAKQFFGATTSSQGGSGTLYPAVSLNLKSGSSGTDGSAVVAQGQTIVSDLAPATRQGYTLTYYSIDEQGSTRLLDSDGTLEAGVGGYTDGTGGWIAATREAFLNGVDVYAQWKKISYEVEFDGNAPEGASTSLQGSMPTMVFAWDESKALSALNFVMPGYYFHFWIGSKHKYNDGQVVSNLCDVSDGTEHLRASWEVQTYGVLFDGNGNDTVQMVGQTFAFDRPNSLAGNKFGKTGYTFLGWKSSDSQGSLYADQERICNLGKFDNGMVFKGYSLTAVWAQNGQVTIAVADDAKPVTGLEASGMLKLKQGDKVYDGFAASTSTSGVYTLGSTAKPIPAGTYEVVLDSSTGYSSEGQTVTVGSDGTGTAMLAYCTVEMSADSHANAWLGQSGTTKLENVPVGSTLEIGCSTNEGYVFDHYAAQLVDPQWEDYDSSRANQTVTVAGTTVIEAHSRAAAYSICFDANGGTGTMNNQSMSYDEAQNLSACAFEREGYTFAGWTETPEWEGTLRADGELIDNALTLEDGVVVTLYAQWLPNAYYIRFDDNGSLGFMLDEEAFCDSPVELALNEYARENWRFVAWSTDSQGNGAAYADGEEAVNLFDRSGNDATLYAQWERDVYAIHFEANGGTGAMADQTAFANMDQQLSSAAFSREGYLFAGWNTAADGGGDVYANADVVRNLAAVGETVTLYAQWAVEEAPEKTPDASGNKGGSVLAETGDSALPVGIIVAVMLASLSVMVLARRIGR